ncbi:DUF551 domain-containing protein [Salmonella enterica subsp. enterica serovar Mikawasima]|nr:DUF551 domain-containing protein [Salmonella enterica]EDB0367221.1 DUF551 domain-containing protein [Salmonella enterica subsp. enterica serovar Mikawasima]EDH3711063.1 DUF551 domain-containing protein [Salmonella enterica subsp. enterica]EDB3588202.1 DUF551 domain-containing protein [Salmonella enterica subsp. enterica serovar Mikawasima]EDC3882470.1 DUF551 domain-containing protein [Salmonella enterica subsp. enterica serovar Mikawasima]
MTITKERLLKIQHWRETYGADSNVMLPAEEAEELARIALAALTAEPVRYLNKFSGTCVTLEQQSNAADDVAVYMPLYAAPPAPVVPEEKPMPNALSMYAVDAVAAIAEVRGWNACRTAMLNGDIFRENSISSTNNFREIAETSTNSPATPDGWISCSERMPENGQECLVQTNSGWRYVSFYDAHSRLFYDSSKGDIEYILVTHWMPVPAAPKPEINNE